MKLEQKRIRTTSRLLSEINKNSAFILGTKMNGKIEKKIKEMFDFEQVKAGISIFPPPFLGIMSKKNSVGEFIAQKNEPKETAYRAQEWTLKDWGGNTHSGTDYVPYKRYPRKFIKPKEFKLIITKMSSNEMFLHIDKIFKNNEENLFDILYAANLMLESIGEVEAFNLDDEKNIIEITPIETINWEILPPGEKIWESFENKRKNILSKGEKTLIKERFEVINEYKPDSIKKGIGGYVGYLIFEFKEKNLFVFDSIIYGDATYIFEGTWEHVSKLTKKEIITQNLAEDRIIHNKSWKKKIKKYLENN